MDNEPLVKEFHAAIMKVATERLGRDLTDKERWFITCRGGFVALALIRDTVAHTADRDEVERYLNSDDLPTAPVPNRFPGPYPCPPTASPA